MKCLECGGEIVTIKGAAYEVIGFEQDRMQGGTNHIMRRKRTGNLLCPTCVIKMRYGVSDDQMTLA